MKKSQSEKLRGLQQTAVSRAKFIIQKSTQQLQMSHTDLATLPISSVGMTWCIDLVYSISNLTVSGDWGHLK
jgi:hypothetical protein